MKKLITAAVATAFALGTTLAFAEDTKPQNPTQKTPTEQQMDSQAKGASKSNMKSGTTGAGMNQSSQGASKLPQKPTDNAKDSVKK